MMLMMAECFFHSMIFRFLIRATICFFFVFQHHEIEIGVSSTMKEFDLFCKPTPTWVEFQMPKYSEDSQSASTAESKSDQHAAYLNRKKVRTEFGKIIKKVGACVDG